jgi:23S rRNA pseudouridine2605 synthase
MTNDGELANRLTHPRFEVKKTYKVWVTGIFAPGKVERLLRGVRLAEGKIALDTIEVLEKDGRDFVLKISIHQGIKREIRRVCAKVGWEVTKLLRVGMGDLELLGLTVGTARKLTEAEVISLKKLVAYEA